MPSALKDRLWLWGQDAGSHHAARANKTWKLPGVNRMEPAEGAVYLGIKNVCRVVMGGTPKPPFDKESEKLKNMSQVVWSAIGDKSSSRNNDDLSDLDEVLRQAELYSNVTGAVLDDFFRGTAIPGKTLGRHSAASVRKMRDRLHQFPKRPLDLWLVWYATQLDLKVADYLELFDVITFWTMRGADLSRLDETIDKVVEKTPGKRRIAGCYMWNYEEGKPFTAGEMQNQCEKYYARMKNGQLEGINFCSNCITDLGLEAVEWVRGWIKEMGDDILP